MNKIFKLILVLSLLVFSTVSISGCSSEKEKIAKEYTGVWRADKPSSIMAFQHYFVIKPNQNNENILDITDISFSKYENNDPEPAGISNANAIIDEKTKTVKMPDWTNTPLVITYENDKKFIKYNGIKYIKISDEPKVPELKDIKF